jgi:hypothetical protein
MPILRHMSMSAAEPGQPFVPIMSAILRGMRLPTGPDATAATACIGRKPAHASAANVASTRRLDGR